MILPFLVRRAAHAAARTGRRLRGALGAPALVAMLAVLALTLVRPLDAYAALPAGSLDTGFGTNGAAITDISGSHSDDTPTSEVMQPDHKIVVAGSTGASPNQRLVLVRYTVYGALDTTFGGTGIVIAPTSAIPASLNVSPVFVALQSNGDIVVAASTSGASAILARFTSSGVLDNTFGNTSPTKNGVMTFGFTGAGDGSLIYGMTVQSDDKIVLSGVVLDLEVGRVKADGSGLDTTFGSSGATSYDWGNAVSDIPGGVAVESNGEIVTSGTHVVSAGNNHVAIARFSSTGHLDSTTVPNITGTSENAQANAIAVAANEQTSTNNDAIAQAGSVGSNYALVIYNSSGTVVKSTTINWGQNAAATAVAFQTDDKIVVAGESNTTAGQIGLARYNFSISGSTLSLDSGFGSSGEKTANYASGSKDDPVGVAVGPYGIAVAAQTLLSGRSDNDFSVGLFVRPFPPTVTANPTNATVTACQNVSFTAAAIGSPLFPDVQWQVSTDGGSTFTNVSGATATTYTFNAQGSQNGYQYHAVFSTGALPDATTSAATLTVNKITTTTSVGSNNNPSTFNQSVKFTATIGGVGSCTPTGTMDFHDLTTSTNLGNGTTITSGGQSTLTISTLTAGSHKISAVYNGDGNYNGSNSDPSGDVNQTVNKATPTITWPSPAAITYGTALGSTQLDATATDPTTSNAVAGTFTYTLADGSTPASGAVLNAGANQTLKVSFAPVDSADYNSATGSTTITVNQASTTLTVAAASGTFGGTTTLQATLISGGNPVSGKTITFTLNGNAVCGGSSQPTCPTTDGSGVATLNNVSLAGINAATYPSGVGASFGPDTNYVSSTGTGQLTVAKATPSLVVAAASGMVGGPTTLQATLTGVGGAGLSGETITFTLNGNSFANNTAITNASGVATLNNVSLAGVSSGTYSASFGGDSNYTSTSNTASLTVNSPGTTADTAGEPTGNPDPALPNTSITFGVSVSFTSGAGPSGSVGFYDGPLGNAGSSTLLGYGTLSVSGSIANASLTLSGGLAAGSHTIWADYYGDANYVAGVSSVALIEAVNNTGSFISFPALQTPRAFFAAAVLPSGQVLVAGGRGSTFSVLNTAELYDPTTGHWTYTNPLNTGRANATATLITSGTHNGQVMLAGGIDSHGTILNTVEFYTPGTNSWTLGTAAETMPTARVFQSAVTLAGGNVLLLGGANSTGRLASADLYTTSSDTWSSAGTTWPPTSQEYETALLLASGPNSGKVLLAGGEDTSFNVLSTVNALDTGTGNESTLATLATGRAFAAGVTLTSGANSGRLMVLGGETKSGSSYVPVSSTEIYDPVGNSWSAGPALLNATALMNGQAVVLAGGQVLYLAGEGTGNAITGNVQMLAP